MRSETGEIKVFSVVIVIEDSLCYDFAGVDEVGEVFHAHIAADELGSAREFVARHSFHTVGADDFEDAFFSLFVRDLGFSYPGSHAKTPFAGFSKYGIIGVSMTKKKGVV